MALLKEKGRRMQGKNLFRLVYNHNPFYLISAGVLLYGVKTSTAVDPNEWVNYWLLAGVLAACAIAMAVTAFLIVRFGKVWDDARSIFMVLFLLFFALSVSFDELCVNQTELAIAMILACLGVALVTTEALLRSLKIRFPWQFRLPFYAILALTFLYPLVFSRQAWWYDQGDMRWLLVLFPVIASVVLLTLLPAARAGKDIAEKNGTPWLWPLFPWSVFAVLAVGLVGRSFLLCEAFDTSHGAQTIFSPFFLSPILIAGAFVLLEIGIKEQSMAARQVALLMCVVALSLSFIVVPGPRIQYFLYSMSSTYGSPLWILLMVTLVFLGIAWLRQVEGSELYLTIVLGLAVFARPELQTLSTEQWAGWPFALFAGYQLLWSIREKSCARFLVGGAVASFGLGLVLDKSVYSEFAVPISLYLYLLIMLFAGWYFDGPGIPRLNAISALLMAVYGLAAMVISISGSLDLGVAAAVIGMFTVMALFCWRTHKDWVFVLAAGVMVAFVLVGLAHSGVGYIEDGSQKRLVGFAIAAVFCFATGVLISSLKAGLGTRFHSDANRAWLDLKNRFVEPPSEVTTVA